MSYDVRLKCPVGTSRLMDAGADRCYWERVYHVITWLTCETYAEAARVARDLEAGAQPGTVHAWTEAR